MKSIKIKISELKPDPKQPRMILEGLKELGKSLKHKGQLSPIIITSDYGILDGHRRYFAAKDMGMEYLDAVVMNGDKRKLTPFLKKAFPFAINTERQEFKAWDMANAICDIYWNYFLEEYTPQSRNDSGYSEFAKYMGLSVTTVRDIIKTYEIAKKSKPLAKSIENKDLPPSILKEIARMPKEKHFDYILLAKEEKEKVKGGASSIYTTLSNIKDRIKDEKSKEALEKKEELPHAYVNRILHKIKTTNNLLDEHVLKLINNKQKEAIKKVMMPLIKFYNKLNDRR